MGARLAALIETIRRIKGPFFIARLALRLRFPIQRAEALDDSLTAELVSVCRELGFDPVVDQSVMH